MTGKCNYSKTLIYHLKTLIYHKIYIWFAALQIFAQNQETTLPPTSMNMGPLLIKLTGCFPGFMQAYYAHEITSTFCLRAN